MTLEEAVEILQDLDSPLPQSHPDKRRQAVKLGKEALSFHLIMKGKGCFTPDYLLPGESLKK